MSSKPSSHLHKSTFEISEQQSLTFEDHIIVADDINTLSSNMDIEEASDDSHNHNHNHNHPNHNDDQTGNTKIKFAVSKRWEDAVSSATGTRKKISIQSICTSMFCCCSRQVGSMHFLLESRNGSPIVVAGPYWPCCMFVTLPLIIGLSGLTLYFCILREGSILPQWAAYIYIPLIVLTVCSLFMVSCRNPGLLERRTEQDTATNSFLWNEQVQSYRPPDALYCRECQVLIEDYDHLCPWTGTGIGGGNMLAFKLFVGMVNVLCYGSIAIAAYVLLTD